MSADPMQAAVIAMLAKMSGEDIPRAEPKVKVRVWTFADGLVSAALPYMVANDAPSKRVGAHLVAREIVADVYESDVAQLERLVEDLTPAVLERVDGDIGVDMQAWVEEATKGRQDVDRAREEAQRTFPGSFPGYFRKAFRRDMRPLLSVARLEDGKKKAA